MRTRFAKAGAVATLLLASNTVWAGNGMLGIFFDQYGAQCSGNVRQGGVASMYVVFLPDGDTRAGITGAEFRIETENADGYSILATQSLLPVALGDPFEGRMNVAGTECMTNLAIPLASIQVQNLSGASNAKFVVKAGSPPSAPSVPCALITLCDKPVYTALCVETGKAVINPTGNTECGSNSESAEWSRIKELYR